MADEVTEGGRGVDNEVKVFASLFLSLSLPSLGLYQTKRSRVSLFRRLNI